MDPATRESLFHHSLYGHKGQPSTERVLGSDYERTKPFSKPITSPWEASISRGDLSNLLNGFSPADMDDKWIVYADGPDEKGDAAVHMFRSWTGLKQIELKIKILLDEAGNVKDGDSQITEIIWESDEECVRGNTEETAKSTAKEVCNWLLDVQLKTAT